MSLVVIMSFSLKQLENKYKNGDINKEEYIQQMHDIHKKLFEYSSFLKNKDIKKIEIKDNQVIMTTRENEIKLICDKIDQRIIPIEILNFDYYEKDEINFILKLIKENDKILDIGANIGYYSLKISKNIENVEILAFEPIPKTFSYLKRNINLNKISNIKFFNYGFSDEEKNLNLYYYPEGSCNASAANLSERKDIIKIPCKFTAIDKFVESNNIFIDFIKCDVEGAELFILKGGFNTIKRDKPIIFVELLRKWAAKFDYHPNEVIKMLKKIDYSCFTIENNHLKEFLEMDENTVETNFLFLNSEKHFDLIKNYKL